MCELTTEQVRALNMLVEFTQTMRRHGILADLAKTAPVQEPKD